MRLLGPTLADAFPFVAARARKRNTGGLTPRMLEVLPLLAEGLTNAQIGRRIGIRSAVVGNCLVRLYRVLGVASRGAAVAAAYERGLVPGAQR